MEKSSARLSIITPSYINSQTRFFLAKKSLESLENTIGTSYHHIVVDDRPRSSFLIPGKVRSRLPFLKWSEKSKAIYSRSNVNLIRRFGSGSASAILTALHEARHQDSNLVFIHLDDHVYLPILKVLVQHACDAFNRDEKLLLVRFSGYPLLYNNRLPLTAENDRISFDSVILEPDRKENYTLWSTNFSENTIDENYWPIALWFCIYRVDFLEKILTNALVHKLKHLAHVELYYKNPANWRQFISRLDGKFGYINMQFGGLEMHRNRNWQELIQLPNEPIR
jgi:hypothetical protein